MRPGTKERNHGVCRHSCIISALEKGKLAMYCISDSSDELICSMIRVFNIKHLMSEWPGASYESRHMWDAGLAKDEVPTSSFLSPSSMAHLLCLHVNSYRPSHLLTCFPKCLLSKLHFQTTQINDRERESLKPFQNTKSVGMGIQALKNGINRRAIACHRRVPGLRKLPFPAVGIIVGLVFANAVVWVAVGILLVWPLQHDHPTLLADANAALSHVRRPWTIQGQGGIGPNLYRALVSTAVLSYTLGLRHALDADHISVCTLWSSRQAHRFLIEDPGNRFDDPSAHSIRSTSGYCWDFLLSWSFHVRLSYRSNIRSVSFLHAAF